MNWQFVLLQLVALIGLVSFTVAIVYYIRHRHLKAVALVREREVGREADGGEFLKRYVPPEHRVAEVAAPSRSLFASRPLFYAACAVVPGAVLVLTGTSYHAQRGEFLEDIVFDASEAAALPRIAHAFEARLNPYAPTLERVARRTPAGRDVVVMRTLADSDYTADAWVTLLERIGIRVSTCTYGRMGRCAIGQRTTVVLSLADAAPSAVTRLGRAGVDVIAYGYPKDVAGRMEAIPGLSFVADANANVTDLAVVGDRSLTLGIDAGTNFPLRPLRGGVRAASERPQAISMFSDGVAGGPAHTRLYADAIGGARLVWMDFSVAAGQWLPPDERAAFDGLVAGILRYALHHAYESIATWPEGHRYAAFFEEDSEDGYANAEGVIDAFEASGVPLTWYVLSDLAEKHRGLTRRMAATGEMACHGDNHDIMPRYDLIGQTERLARCREIVARITGERPTGFRPPTEAHDANTLSALVNVGMTHLFAENSTPTQVPHFKVAPDSGARLVSIPRAISDDYQLWNSLHLDGTRSIARLRDELAWIRRAGSLFGFSFHTQFMGEEELLGVVTALLREVRDEADVYINTVGGVAAWWTVRDALLSGGEVTEAEFERHAPVRLSVGEDGRLARERLSAAKPLARLAGRSGDGASGALVIGDAER